MWNCFVITKQNQNGYDHTFTISYQTCDTVWQMTKQFHMAEFFHEHHLALFVQYFSERITDLAHR